MKVNKITRGYIHLDILSSIFYHVKFVAMIERPSNEISLQFDYMLTRVFRGNIIINAILAQ